MAKVLRARATPGSGSIEGAKGDCVLPELLVECKSTNRGSLSVQQAWLEKITREALARNRAPALTLSFVDANGQPRGPDWIAIPHWLAIRVGLVPAETYDPAHLRKRR